MNKLIIMLLNIKLKKLESLKGHLIPDNVHVTITRNYGKTANDKVNELFSSGFQSIPPLMT